MTTNSNPDLLQPSAASSQSVPAQVAITAPMPNTKVDPVYFFCTLATASMHRPDGKKLPFVNHFLKCEVKEDIAYLRKEIEEYQNAYIREATPDEAAAAQMRENPVEAIKTAVRSEIEESFSIEQLQALIDKRKNTVRTPQPKSDAEKIAGIDKTSGGKTPAGFSLLHAKGSNLVAATADSLKAAAKDSNS